MPRNSNVRKKYKPSITVVGPGRLGMALGLALSKRNYRIQALVGRDLKRTRRAAFLLDVQPALVVAKDLPERVSSDIVLIATPDDQIAGLAQRWAKHFNATHERPVVLHTSGALSSDTLAPLARLGWSTGSIHPLVSVSDPLEGSTSFRNTYWCLEGSGSALKTMKRLVSALEGKSFAIKSADKPLYHAAAVMTSGNVVAVFDIALDMLSECGLTRAQAQKVLLPLLRSTVDNLVTREPSAALTGTFSRGDVATVEQHLKSLTGKHLVEALEAYKLLGKKSLRLAAAKGLDPAIRKKIEKRLKE